MQLPWSPILLHYYITYRCNCKCQFCDIWDTPGNPKSQFADLEAIRQNLEQGRKLGLKFVDFTGGEPLLHTALPEMLDMAKSMGYRTTLTTNGILYPQKAKDLLGKVDLLHFSLDSLDPQQHNTLRGKNVFDSLMLAIDTALALGETPDILYTVTQENIGQLENLARFAGKLGLMLIINPVFSHVQQHQLAEGTLQRIESFRKLPYVYINSAFHQLRRMGGNNPENPRCRVTTSTIVISPDNHLLLPCFHHHQYKIPVNNSLYSLYHSDKIKDYKNMEGKYDFCSGCVMNCYMDPSFLYKADSYLTKSLWSKTRYAWNKYIRRPVEKHTGRLDTRPAAEIAQSIRELNQCS